MAADRTSTKVRRAVTVGSAVVDIIAVVANKDIERLTLQNTAASFLLLEPGRKIEADGISIHTGGGAINTAVALRRLGYEAAPLVKIGLDLNASKVLETIATEQLGDRLVTRSNNFATGVAVAKVMTLGPCARRSAHSLASRSWARCDPVVATPSMLESTRRFL